MFSLEICCSSNLQSVKILLAPQKNEVIPGTLQNCHLSTSPQLVIALPTLQKVVALNLFALFFVMCLQIGSLLLSFITSHVVIVLPTKGISEM